MALEAKCEAAGSPARRACAFFALPGAHTHACTRTFAKRRAQYATSLSSLSAGTWGSLSMTTTVSKVFNICTWRAASLIRTRAQQRTRSAEELHCVSHLAVLLQQRAVIEFRVGEVISDRRLSVARSAHGRARTGAHTLSSRHDESHTNSVSPATCAARWEHAGLQQQSRVVGNGWRTARTPKEIINPPVYV